MGLRDILKKKDGIDDGSAAHSQDPYKSNGAEFTFIRTDTSSQEVIHPQDYPNSANSNFLAANPATHSPRRSLDIFGSSRTRSTSVSSQASHTSSSKRRLSEMLHLVKQPESSDYVPENLPDIVATPDPAADQSQWEKRATILAGQNEMVRSGPPSPPPPPSEEVSQLSLGSSSRRRNPSPSPSRSPVGSKAIDQDIQEAIQLHEEGNFEQSTRIFGRLADPHGANNPLSQVLYGLALR